MIGFLDEKGAKAENCSDCTQNLRRIMTDKVFSGNITARNMVDRFSWLVPVEERIYPDDSANDCYLLKAQGVSFRVLAADCE